MDILNIRIDQVKPYGKNPRINADSVPQVVKSLKEFGWQQPLVVDKDMVLIVGHTRLLAAKELKMTTVPVVIADLTPAKAKAYRLMDNRTHERSTWDDKLLVEELIELTEFYTPEFLDFSEIDLGLDEPEPTGDPDEIPEVVPAVTKLGDLYLLDPYYECSACKKVYDYAIGKDLKECSCGVAA